MLLTLSLSCGGFRAAPHPEADMAEAALAAQRFGAGGDEGFPPFSGDAGFPRFPTTSIRDDESAMARLAAVVEKFGG